VVKLNVRKLAKELGIPHTTLLWRIKNNWEREYWGMKKNKPKEGFKLCSHCFTEKPLESFYKRSGRNGYLSWCKSCVAKKTSPKAG
jgi:hypothetical protein